MSRDKLYEIAESIGPKRLRMARRASFAIAIAIVVISSQLGVPIAVYQGNSVGYEIPDDLPKFTKLTIDGKALYIHRANYMIIDKDAL